ncbi:phosphate-starvation-inducible PsiE family protein [Crenothrix polyspora]|uniref:BLUF domain protein n=1 Tax=Crenothrix polyspora TaxID=360316 RepID=A0A1R4HIW9_9GAMM|nr:phosphate-starvation-inducible PsiE family protein [Crenothrix polyspora]SJM96163.1 BLUF domain protein [Crenothrix polyspora]
MIRLTYASTATHKWSAEDLLKLLKQCRTNNGAKNITGILLYANGTFFQVLEGDEATVESVYQKIKQGPRNRECTVIEKQAITERAFPYWSMGFEKINAKELHKMDGLSDFFEHDFTPAGFVSHKNIIGPLLTHLRAKLIKQVSASSHEELPLEHEDPFIRLLHGTIRVGVKFLSFLMVIVIVLSIFDVLYTIWDKISDPPYLLLTTNDLLETFGSFLAVLIAIEIFINISLYIRSDVIPVKLVVATALMAISRKFIVFDYKHLQPEYISATALVVVALGITYMLIQKNE